MSESQPASHIVVYAPNAYPVASSYDADRCRLRTSRWFAPNCGQMHFGGIETRAVTLASALSRTANTTATLVVENPAADPVQTCEQLSIVGRPNYRQQARRNLRQHSPIDVRNWWRWSVTALGRVFGGPAIPDETPDDFFQALEASAAITFGTNRQSLCLVRSVDFSVLCIAANADVDPRIAEGAISATAYGEPTDVVLETINEASLIIAQSEQQRDLLRDSFGRESHVIPNPIDLAWWDTQLTRSSTRRTRKQALWIGRADLHHKRPLLAIEAAHRSPEWSWTLVMNAADPLVAAEVEARMPTNVTVVESVPFASMPNLMAQHDVFVSTADPAAEGFPNVFLQAAASGLRVVTLGAGSQFVAEAGCGFVVDSVDQIAATLNEWNPETHGQFASQTAIRKHLDLSYSAAAIAGEFARLVRNNLSSHNRA